MLGSYNHSTENVSLPNDYVLVIDQSINDAAITLGGADADSFSDMLATAKAENPDKKILGYAVDARAH